MKNIAGLITAFIIVMTMALLAPGDAIAAEGTVVNESTGVTYSSISEAVNDITAGSDVVLRAEGDFSEDITLNKVANITLKKGNADCNITGSFSVSTGKLTLEGLNINGRVTYSGQSSSGSLKDCNIVTNGTGVSVSGGATVDEISKVSISRVSIGIKVGPGGYIKNIDGGEGKSTITAIMQGIAVDVFNNSSDHSNDGKIDRIANCKISITGSSSSLDSDYGAIMLRGWEPNAGIEIGTIENCEISAASASTYHAGLRMVNNSNTAPVKINRIKDCTISSTKGSSGLYLQYAQIGEILDTHISASQGAGRAVYTGVVSSAGGAWVCPNHIGKIEGGSITSTGANSIYMVSRTGYGIGSISNTEITGYYGGLYIGGGDVGDITNVKIKQTYEGANSRSDYGGIIEKASNVKIGNLTDVDIDAQGLGIYLATRVTVGDMKHVTIKAGRQDVSYSFGSGMYISTGSTVKSISGDSEITSEKSQGLTIYGTGSGITNNISDTSINGRYIGIYNYNGSIGGMENVNVTAVKHETKNQCVGLYNSTATSTIGNIVGGSITATDGNTGYGIFNNLGKIGDVKGTTITALSRAINNQREGVIGTLKDVTATAQNEMAIQVASGASVSCIDGGVYTGGTDAVTIGNASSGAASLGTIIGNAVFYGKTGYAINNAEASDKIIIEPDIPDKLKGNARYYGALGVENNNHIQVPDKDTYPVFTPTNLNYKMSKNTTSVDGFDGVPFHYLTIDIDLKYDGNGGTGNVEGYSGEYREDLTAEENGFTRKNYVFTGWNTKADGKGTAYKPGDTIDITEEKTTLYAQWEYRGSIEVSFGILNPYYRIDGVRLRDIQSSYYYCVSWLLQPYYSGGAATLVDSNGEIVESFSDEYQHTFDNLPPGEYDIVLDVLDQGPLCLNAGVHNGAPRSDIIVWSEDSDKLHVTIPENGTGVIRRWISLERKAFGFKTVTDVGEFRNNPSGSEIPGKPSSDGKEYVYYAVRDGGNNWSFENPQIDEKPHMPFVQSHIGIYYGESASLYSGMTGLQVPELSDKEKAMGYKFKGWKLQGDDSGKIYTESEALAYTVRKHVVFEALWDKAPPKNAEHKFEGKAILLKNGVQKDISAGQFEFTISHLSGDADGFTGIQSGSSVNSDGSFSFDKLTFSKAGEYKFEINQIDKGQAGYLYDMNPVTATVKVTYNENNNSLEAAVEYVKSNTDAEGIFFTNTYSSLPVKSGPQAEKKVEGEPEEPSEFTFVLTPKNEEFPMPDGKVGGTKEVTIKGGGKVEFGDIDFDKEGVYEYTVKEKIPEDADESGKSGDYIYDKAEWTIKFEVTDDEEGQLVVKKTITKNGETVDSIEISNRYEKRAELESEPEPEPQTEPKPETKPEPQIQSQPEPQTQPKKDPLPCVGDPPVEKKIEGNPDKETTFTFILTPKDPSNPMPDGKVGGSKEGTITGAGSFEFGDIVFTKEGTYEYTVTEKIPEGADANNKYGDYVYDDSKWTIRYVVTDNNGQLEVTRTFLKDGEVVEGMQAVTITNVYDNPVAEVLEEEEEEAESEEIEEKTKEKTIEKTKAVKTKTVAKNKVSPKTEDEFNLRLWIVLVAISAIGLMWAYAVRIRG